MVPEIKKRLIVALRSGDYKQTRGALCEDGGYCCLGVLCELAMIDPDSPVSSVDSALASELDLFVVQAAEEPDESDTKRPARIAEIREFELGDLRVSNRTVRLHEEATVGRVRDAVGVKTDRAA